MSRFFVGNLCVLNTIWYGIKQPDRYTTIGIVSVEDRITKKRKMYIGPGTGNFEQDVVGIVEYGVPFLGELTAKWIMEELNGQT